MRSSTDRIVTTQSGSLPRPDDLIELNRAREQEGTEEAAFRGKLDAAVTDLVADQRAAGIDVVGDGEFGKSMSSPVNYGAWWSYSFQRLGGLELGQVPLSDVGTTTPEPGEIALTTFGNRRDRKRFPAVDNDPSDPATTRKQPSFPICRGPLTYTGHDAIRADIASFRKALDAAGLEEGFMTSIAPGSCSRIGNEHYDSDDEFLFACADAMREEYGRSSTRA